MHHHSQNTASTRMLMMEMVQIVLSWIEEFYTIGVNIFFIISFSDEGLLVS
jgi:hypothetical protein